LAEAPQRQRENAVLPVRSYWLPSASAISTTPLGSSTRKGPFLRTVIVTCAMEPPVEMNSFQTIAQEKKLPVLSTKYSVQSRRSPSSCARAFHWVLDTGYCYRHRSTASHHSIFAHSSKVVFAHSRFVHQASPNCAGLRAAATLNWYCGRRWRKISKARRV